MKKPQICLGTAQFGLPYGITNKSGQVTEKEIDLILLDAVAGGLRMLDTAQAYGDSESVLGRVLRPDHSFKIVSKLPSLKKAVFTEDDQLFWEMLFENSLVSLGESSIDALLLHSSSDLRKPGGEHLRHWLLTLRDRGLVQRLGVSIYDSTDLDGVDNDLLDLVQLPLSLYDQRFLEDGTIQRLRSQGCALHARSIFLQGLLLTPAATWPDWVEPASRAHHERLEKFAEERGCSLFDCALGFATAQHDLEAVVIGICSQVQMSQLIEGWMKVSPWNGNEWNRWSMHKTAILDPRTWQTHKL